MKKVYVISHSHWDREWYLPYEQHHMRLVELMDDLLALFESDPDFKSFHLDGQTIILDDYIEVRPEKRELLQRYISEGRLKIGPFYILQDDFLISSESNTRNMLIGMAESKKWGAPVQLGYFPDTFGNMGQTPQMMRLANLDVAAFGRGVKPTGFNNVVVNDEKYASQFSEMWWEGPDGSKILGLLFANWYSNGNEIPSEREAAKIFWEQKLKDAEQYASTDHLLMMNGCDHQPVQKDLSEALRVAGELYPDIEFIHGDFDQYLAGLKEAVPESLSTVTGELTSQETEGWYTLANTASSRVYLKQWNTRVSRQLENIAEPLATMAREVTGKYPHDTLNFAWKKLMQNHPHDSICGCSVDEVHRGMVTRFEAAYEVGKYVADESARQLLTHINTEASMEKNENGYPFVVFNTSGSRKTDIVKVVIEVDRLPLGTEKPEILHARMAEKELPEYIVKNSDGEQIPAIIKDKGAEFHYDLPKDAFRKPYMARYVEVELLMQEMPIFSWETFALVENQTGTAVAPEVVDTKNNQIDNEYLTVTVEQDGTLTVLDKENQKVYSDLLCFENVGDLGNEYIFKQPEQDVALLSKDYPTEIRSCKKTIHGSELELVHRMSIPVSMDECLPAEQKAVVEFRERKAERSKTLAELELVTKLTLRKGSRQLQFSTTFNNQMKDHRLRVLFPTGLKTDVHYADSIYEVVERPNTVDEAWKNPTNAQHQHAFVNIQDEKQGVTVANYGLNEYEILPENQTIALTLLRAVGEMGDWGYFATPEAQCQGHQKMDYAISFHGSDDEVRTYHEAFAFQVPFSVYQVERHSGELAPKQQYVQLEEDRLAFTALKAKEDNEGVLTRLYNLTQERLSVDIKLTDKKPEKCNLLEEKLELENVTQNQAGPAEIITYCWE